MFTIRLLLTKLHTLKDYTMKLDIYTSLASPTIIEETIARGGVIVNFGGAKVERVPLPMFAIKAVTHERPDLDAQITEIKDPYFGARCRSMRVFETIRKIQTYLKYTTLTDVYVEYGLALGGFLAHQLRSVDANVVYIGFDTTKFPKLKDKIHPLPDAPTLTVFADAMPAKYYRQDVNAWEIRCVRPGFKFTLPDFIMQALGTKANLSMNEKVKRIAFFGNLAILRILQEIGVDEVICVNGKSAGDELSKELNKAMESTCSVNFVDYPEGWDSAKKDSSQHIAKAKKAQPKAEPVQSTESVPATQEQLSALEGKFSSVAEAAPTDTAKTTKSRKKKAAPVTDAPVTDASVTTE